jgi:hypothetical protein
MLMVPLSAERSIEPTTTVSLPPIVTLAPELMVMLLVLLLPEPSITPRRLLPEYSGSASLPKLLSQAQLELMVPLEVRQPAQTCGAWLVASTASSPQLKTTLNKLNKVLHKDKVRSKIRSQLENLAFLCIFF